MAVMGALLDMGYQNAPRLVLFADSPAGRVRVREAAMLVAGTPPEPSDVKEAIARLDAQIALDTVLVDLTEDHGPALDALLDRLEAGARARRFTSVVSLPRTLIDVAASRAEHSEVMLLVDPPRSELLAALSVAIARGSLRLQDVNAETPGQQLKQLSDEVSRIAQLLARIANEESQRSAPGIAEAPHDLPSGADDRHLDPATIRAVIRARRMRDHYFPGGLFADPAWDMLLDLMAARLEQQPVAVSSLCIASSVPPTTALRWIKTLAESGLFVRTADPHDKRRVFIELSETAAKAMTGYFAALQRAGGAAI